MNKARIDQLVERANRLYRCINKADVGVLGKIEKDLGVILSEEYKYICISYLYENLDDFYSIYNQVVKATLDLRKKKKLPHRFLYLASDGTSSFFMETKADPQEPSPVYWIDWMEREEFCKEVPLKLQNRYFPSFTDFFENLIERMEKFQQEETEADGVESPK